MDCPPAESDRALELAGQEAAFADRMPPEVRYFLAQQAQQGDTASLGLSKIPNAAPPLNGSPTADPPAVGGGAKRASSVPVPELDATSKKPRRPREPIQQAGLGEQSDRPLDAPEILAEVADGDGTAGLPVPASPQIGRMPLCPGQHVCPTWAPQPIRPGALGQWVPPLGGSDGPGMVAAGMTMYGFGQQLLRPPGSMAWERQQAAIVELCASEMVRPTALPSLQVEQPWADEALLDPPAAEESVNGHPADCPSEQLGPQAVQGGAGPLIAAPAGPVVYLASRKSQTKKMKWLPNEEAIIRTHVEQYGPSKWSKLERLLPGRKGKQCRERWHNQLDPTINKGPWTPEENQILLCAHATHGNQWATISKELPGRTDNGIKNHFNKTFKGLVRHTPPDQAEQQSPGSPTGSGFKPPAPVVLRGPVKKRMESAQRRYLEPAKTQMENVETQIIQKTHAFTNND